MDQPQQPDSQPNLYDVTIHRDEAIARAALATVQAALADPNPAGDATILKVSRLATEMQQLPAFAATDIQFAVLQSVGRFFLVREGYLRFGMEAAAYTCILARRLGRKQELLNGLLLQGVIALNLQNSIEAIESFVAARDLALDLTLPRAEIVAVMNGGAVLLDAGHYPEALTTFEHCLVLSEHCPNVSDVIGNLWSNVAQCNLVLDRFEQGLQAVAKARTYMVEPSDAHAAGARATLESTHIRLLVATKQGQQIRSMLQALTKYAVMSGSQRSRIELNIARGLLAAVVLKQRDVGLTLIRNAIASASAVPQIQLDVLAAMVNVSEQTGASDEAAKYRSELDALISARRETSRFRAELLKPGLGIGAAASTVTAYDKRLRAAHDRLLGAS